MATGKQPHAACLFMLLAAHTGIFLFFQISSILFQAIYRAFGIANMLLSHSCPPHLPTLLQGKCRLIFCVFSAWGDREKWQLWIAFTSVGMRCLHFLKSSPVHLGERGRQNNHVQVCFWYHSYKMHLLSYMSRHLLKQQIIGNELEYVTIRNLKESKLLQKNKNPALKKLIIC